MENCTIINDQKICYLDINHHNNEGSYILSSFIRDIKLIVTTILLTCIAMAAYNYYLYCQVEKSKSKKKKKQQQDELMKKKKSSKQLAQDQSDNNDPFANEMNSKGRNSLLLLDNSERSNLSTSLAASLANIQNGVPASGNFLTAIFSQMWNHVNIAISNTIKETLEPTLKDLKVPLHFVKLDLGDVPLETKNMFIHRVDLAGLVDVDGDGITDIKNRDNKQAGIQIDVDVVWDGNCDIMLQATLTKSAKVTFGVKSIKLKGRMHILLSPLTTELPVISAIQYGFTNPPEIDLDFSGAMKSLTSKAGFVESAILQVVQSSMASMLVLPNRMVMPMDLGSYDYLDTYQPPVGMVRLKAVSGRGFTILKKMLLNDIPDTYCVISLGGSNAFRPPFRTSTQYDNLEPCWEDEWCDFILYDMDQKVYVEVFDEDKTPIDPDDFLGKFEIRVRDLFKEPNDGVCEVELELDGEKTGCYITVSAELFYLSEQLHSFPDGLGSEKYEGKNELCGLATVIVTKAFDIPIPKEDAATYIKVKYGEGEHKKTFYTGTVTDYPGLDALNPMYDMVFHIPLSAAMLRQDKKTKEEEEDAVAAAAAAFGGSTPTSPPSKKSANGMKRGSILAMSTSLATTAGSHCASLATTAGSSLVTAGATVAKTTTSLVTRRGSNCSDKKNDITFTLIDSDGANGTPGHGTLGKMVVTHDELRRAYRHTITQTRPIGDKGAKLEFRVILSGMQSEDARLEWAAATNKSRVEQAPQADPFGTENHGSMYSSVYEDGVTIRVTAVRGRGFSIKKRRFGKKDDVPDLYCIIKLVKFNDANQQEQRAPSWQTAMIKDDTMPTWNESRDFHNIAEPARHLISVDVYDKNSTGRDDCLGSAKFSLEKLLRKRLLELELRNGNSMSKSFVTLRCIQLTQEKVEVGDVMIHNHPDMGDEGFESTMMNGKHVDSDDEEGGDVVTPLLSLSDRPSSRVSHRISSDSDDDQSVNSTSSNSSISRKLSKVKSLPGKLKKIPSFRRRKKSL